MSFCVCSAAEITHPIPSESLVKSQAPKKLSSGGWRKGSVVTALPAQVGEPELGSPAKTCKASWAWAVPVVGGGGVDRTDRPNSLARQSSESLSSGFKDRLYFRKGDGDD